MPSASPDQRSPQRALRVLHASPCYAPAYRLGGPVRSLEGLLPALQAEGVQVRVVTTDGHGPERLNVPRDWHERDGIPVRYLRRWLRPDVTPLMFREVLSETKNAHIVHATGFFCVPTVLAIAAARLRRRPVVVSPRGALEGGSLSVGNRAAKRTWLRTFGPLFATVDAYHATSEKEAASIRRVLGAKSRVLVVPNGTTLATLASGKSGGRPLIGALGRIHPNKGYDRLVDACATLRDAGADFELRIAGPESDAQHARDLRAQIEARGLQDRASLCGEVLHTAKDDFLRSCRVLVMPSNDTENFGNVVIEALAQETPVIASSFAPWAELEDEACGAWVPNTPARLASALEPYLADETYARERGRRGRALVERKYTWQAVARQMLTAYRELYQGQGEG